jgi:hypothetical protein
MMPMSVAELRAAIANLQEYQHHLFYYGSDEDLQDWQTIDLCVAAAYDLIDLRRREIC